MAKLNWRYALGEILIVIIGITIAFSLNKWAQNKQQESQKQQYLVNLKSELEADKEALENNVEQLRIKMATVDKIIPVLGGDDNNAKMAVINGIFSVSRLSNFSANDITYHTLINSGDLKLLDDFALKTAIQRHYSNYEDMMKDYERQENIHKEYLGRYFIQNADYDAFPKGVFGFDDELLLKNIMQSMRGSFSIKLFATQRGIESCDSLLTEISNHLKT